MTTRDYFKSHRTAPSTQAPEAVTPCGRGCCWTPYGCGRQKTCACHPKAKPLPDLEALLEKEETND